ncbi:hypothetical protein [Dawidia soli]|uniref:Uncharacterized protein n=1 Tax=Dawidia soli TaxID=2782352 RepID=A0AAP2D5D9_9BACT|nr:hypothetical protein [Dawidia soli]MBT1685678.1 hypothetical protein [Dawidia soli]
MKTTKNSNTAAAKKNVPANKATKATKATHTKAKAPKKEDKLPGEYPPSEDIMNPGNGMERVHVDLEDMSTSRMTEKQMTEEVARERRGNTESDLTKEDRRALGSDGLNSDEGDDDQLRARVTPVDFAGKDLDIPGSELDDASEAIGTEDEENNSYSLGGDNHEDLEEDRA